LGNPFERRSFSVAEEVDEPSIEFADPLSVGLLTGIGKDLLSTLEREALNDEL